ncbi:MAG: hemerythrin family protein [Gemmatimonadetes bacterium]|nr:hemerythrin family protein [Gemmatimonadota bacterium]
MKYEWTEAMATGVAELDEEHRILISWINRLSDANESGDFESEVKRILAFLAVYAAKHFTHEERCFNETRCPFAAANKQAHDGFVALIDRTRAECEEHGVTLNRALELHHGLGSWLQSHILRLDTTLKPCVGLMDGDRRA